MDDLVEIRPSTQAMKFSFDTTQACLNAKDLFNQRNNVKTEIDDILKRIPQEMPSIAQVFPYFWAQLMADKHSRQKNMKILARAFKHLSTLIEKFEKLDEQTEAINYILEHPDFIAAIFGDFSHSVPDSPSAFPTS